MVLLERLSVDFLKIAEIFCPHVCVFLPIIESLDAVLIKFNKVEKRLSTKMCTCVIKINYVFSQLYLIKFQQINPNFVNLPEIIFWDFSSVSTMPSIASDLTKVERGGTNESTVLAKLIIWNKQISLATVQHSLLL